LGERFVALCVVEVPRGTFLQVKTMCDSNCAAKRRTHNLGVDLARKRKEDKAREIESEEREVERSAKQKSERERD
jgi:hypothetical protein